MRRASARRGLLLLSSLACRWRGPARRAAGRAPTRPSPSIMPDSRAQRPAHRCRTSGDVPPSAQPVSPCPRRYTPRPSDAADARPRGADARAAQPAARPSCRATRSICWPSCSTRSSRRMFLLLASSTRSVRRHRHRDHPADAAHQDDPHPALPRADRVAAADADAPARDPRASRQVQGQPRQDQRRADEALPRARREPGVGLPAVVPAALPAAADLLGHQPGPRRAGHQLGAAVPGPAGAAHRVPGAGHAPAVHRPTIHWLGNLDAHVPEVLFHIPNPIFTDPRFGLSGWPWSPRCCS